MALTATDLREGFVVAFHCLGDDAQPTHAYLKGSAGAGVVSLSQDPNEAGAQWTVHVSAASGVLSFQCGEGGFLDGRTLDCTVGLAPSAQAPFIGAQWKVTDLPNPDQGGFNHVSLQTQGNLGDPNQGQCPFGFLDGRTALSDGSVGLARSTEEPFSGTHWELLLSPVFPGEGGSSGDGGADSRPH